MANNTGYRGDLKFAYEQSINAYQHHVQRYGTWMNMYAIITGALLVAFCSFYGTEKSSNDFLTCLIAVLGWISSLCWYGCVKGHYEWMKSFMSIVKRNEKEYFSKYGDYCPFVYAKVLISKSLYKPKGDYIQGFFSTQKITLVFIMLVSLAWAITFCSIVSNSCIRWPLIVVIILLYLLTIKQLRDFICNPLRHSHSTIHPNEIEYY